MEEQPSASRVTKVLSVLALVLAALAVGRWWGRSTVTTPASPPAQPPAPSQPLAPSQPPAHTAPSATAHNDSEGLGGALPHSGVEIHWDAGSLTLLPDAGIAIPKMPELDPDKLLQGAAGAPPTPLNEH